MADLPRWVLDLVCDLIDEEAVHPKLYADTINGYQQYDWCPNVPLKRVPGDVLVACTVLAGYRKGLAEAGSADG